MTCRDISHAGTLHRICPDDPPRAADRLRAVVKWTAIDEITRRAPDIEFSITPLQHGLTARVSRDGVMGVVGNPGRLFPGLDSAAVDLGFQLEAPGYLPRVVSTSLGPIAGFPNAFAPADLGVVELHRDPLVLRGRVVRQAGLFPLPLSGVSISVVAIWSTWPAYDVDFDLAMEPANVISLSPGLYAERASGTDVARRRDVTLAVGQEKTLLDSAIGGTKAVRVSDSVGLGAGDLLALGAGDRREYVSISAIDPASSDDQPAVVTLEHPLVFEQREGSLAVRATLAAPGPNRALTRSGIRGDCIAFLSAITGIPDAGVIEISGGAAAEYQTVHRYETSSDADAYWRLPSLSRLAAVRLHAERFDLPSPLELVASLDYRRHEQRFDLVFP